jgi:hypothetical protein
LFLRDGFVIGSSRLLRSLLIPLGLDVETGVLEIASLDLGMGLIIGDFHDWFKPRRKKGPATAAEHGIPRISRRGAGREKQYSGGVMI